MVGPATNPNSPKTSMPPTTLMNSSNSFKRVRLRNSMGRNMLSATVATPPQINTTTRPLPQGPLNPSHSAPGTQTSAEPTTGTSEKNATNTPQNIGVVIPTKANAIPPRIPCTAATSSPIATLAIINSFDSPNMSSWMDSSKGKRCRTACTMLSPP